MWLYANITGIYLVKIHYVLVSQCYAIMDAVIMEQALPWLHLAISLDGSLLSVSQSPKKNGIGTLAWILQCNYALSFHEGCGRGPIFSG